MKWLLIAIIKMLSTNNNDIQDWEWESEISR